MVLGLAVGLLALVTVRSIHPFLALTKPAPNGVLVVEGWSPDYALELAMAEFRRNHYDKLYVTGGPLERGAPLSEYKSFAELGAATLVRLGLSSNAVQAVPAPLVRQDRTYTSAVTLRQWCQEHGISLKTMHVMTEGPHARRSRLLFKKAFGNEVVVGVTAVPVRDYDPQHWWRSSAGVRTVISEALAYGYVRLFFWPSTR